MEFDEVVTTTGAIRDFEDRPVPDSLVYEILGLARFAPSGGNRQGWRVVVVKDKAIRARLRDLYVQAWAEYMAHVEAGFVPFAPWNGRRWTEPAVDLEAAAKKRYEYHFSDHLDEVPVMLAVFVKLGSLAVLDNGLDRQSIVGGGSIYPFVHNIMLAARSRGLGGVMTTAICRREPDVARVMGMPDEYGLASLVALGWPKRLPGSLRRAPVERFTTVDTFDGEEFNP